MGKGGRGIWAQGPARDPEVQGFEISLASHANARGVRVAETRQSSEDGRITQRESRLVDVGIHFLHHLWGTEGKREFPLRPTPAFAPPSTFHQNGKT